MTRAEALAEARRLLGARATVWEHRRIGGLRIPEPYCIGTLHGHGGGFRIVSGRGDSWELALADTARHEAQP